MTKRLMVGDVAVGGGAPVSIQSMCNTKTDDVRATVEQIHALEAAGCEIIRIAIPDQAAAESVDRIKEQISIPLIADIHFNYKYALACAERGIDLRKALREHAAYEALEPLGDTVLTGNTGTNLCDFNVLYIGTQE